MTDEQFEKFQQHPWFQLWDTNQDPRLIKVIRQGLENLEQNDPKVFAGLMEILDD